jgi:hypothetical protein
MLSVVLSSSVVDRGFEPRSDQTKDDKISICRFSTELKSKRKDWLARNQDHVSEWGVMSIIQQTLHAHVH